MRLNYRLDIFQYKKICSEENTSQSDNDTKKRYRFSSGYFLIKCLLYFILTHGIILVIITFMQHMTVLRNATNGSQFRHRYAASIILHYVRRDRESLVDYSCVEFTIYFLTCNITAIVIVCMLTYLVQFVVDSISHRR